MADRLFVGVLGHRNAGKSKTWNTLFGRTVRTGPNARTLALYGGECAEVFLVSGSHEERGLYAGDIIGQQDCRIVLCSMQYVEEVRQTLDYVVGAGFDMHVHWLNPGWADSGETYDRLGLGPWLLGHGATLALRSGKADPIPRTEELRQAIYGWAKARSLTFPC